MCLLANFFRKDTRIFPQTDIIKAADRMPSCFLLKTWEVWLLSDYFRQDGGAAREWERAVKAWPHC